MGMNTSMPGQEGIPSVFSPMARTLEDLVYFSRSLIGMKPWLWDHTVHPIEWRTDEVQKVRESKRFRIGVMRTDGKRGSVFPKTALLNHFQVSSTHPQPALVHSNAPCQPSLPKATLSLTSPHHPLTVLSSSPPSFSALMAAKCSSPFSGPARATTRALVKCPYT